MLTKRIIPCLDIKDGRTVKGTHFTNLRDAGDPVELAMLYTAEGADELVFLDITATIEKRRTLYEPNMRDIHANWFPEHTHIRTCMHTHTHRTSYI